jgi:hypothetical protein
MYAVKLGKYFVSGFDKKFQIIQITDNIEFIKKFKTKKSAYNWCEKHENADFGIDKDYFVVEI